MRIDNTDDNRLVTISADSSTYEQDTLALPRIYSDREFVRYHRGNG